MMLFRILKSIDMIFRFDQVSAHCDIPCGIYDPIAAQIAALTVIRMVDLMTELDEKGSNKGTLDYENRIARYIRIKEEHAEKCKQGIQIIWGDYFKPQHHEQFSELMRLTDQIMKLGSESKQLTNRKKAMELLEHVNRFAEIFWETKGLQTKRAAAPYEPKEELVYPRL